MAHHLVPLPPVEQVEQQLRSIAMLSPGQPALNREDAYILLAQLIVALMTGPCPGIGKVTCCAASG